MSSGHSGRFARPFSRLPIRVRLAASVAAVAFLILVVFAVAVGRVEAHRLRRDFDAQVRSNAQIAVRGRFGGLSVTPATSTSPPTLSPPVAELVGVPGAVAAVWDQGGDEIASSRPKLKLGSPLNAPVEQNYNGYRVVTLAVQFVGFDGGGYLQYAQPLSEVSNEIYDLQLLLFLGALIGTVIAFGAGSLVARRAMAPVAQLTAAAAEIEQTGDASRTLPEPVADDEIAELSRTLSAMLTSLNDARNETEAALERQREFVADASHELRTPLTSVLANLELLVEALRGPDREAAESALRSTQRMRRLVGDLLLLARADGGQASVRERLDLADAVVEATSELGPAAGEHAIELDLDPAPLVGNRDDLQRVATNLIENALRHTPPGTRVTASTRALADGGVELVVADDGPGIAPDARATLFERFVRGGGDRGGSFGLGLAIVAAVTQAHNGAVKVDESPHGGARFTVTLPAATLEPAPSAPGSGAESIAPRGG
jgi:two-component system, OmpR family, sensor kinase